MRFIVNISAVPIMGRLDRLSSPQLFEIQIALVPLYAEFDPSDEPFFEKKSLGLAECFVSSEKPVATGRALAHTELRLIWTVML